MPRSRVIFLVIILSAILLVLVSQVVQRLPVAPTPTPLPALQIEVAVNPLAYDWVSEQAAKFNLQQPQTEGQPLQIQVTQRDSIDVWQTGGLWSTANHPIAWIPEATFSLNYAADTGARYEALTASVASTSLIWGVFADRAGHIIPPVDWSNLHDATNKGSWSVLGGDNGWGFVKPAFAPPDRNTAGLGVLFSAAADFTKNGNLTPQSLSDGNFQEWFRPIIEAVPSFASLGQRPITTLASRGVSAADFAMLPESEWLQSFNQINTRQQIKFFYPAYKVLFDMPFAVWSGSETTAAQRSGAKQFADFLIQSTAQKRAAAFGLRPVQIKVNDADTSLFSTATGAGIVMDNPPGTVVTVPTSRNSVLGLLSWFKSVRSS